MVRRGQRRRDPRCPVGLSGQRVDLGDLAGGLLSVSGGRMPGRRSASIVAGPSPDRNRWCPPAAQTSSAWRAAWLPDTSARSTAKGDDGAGSGSLSC